MNDLLYIQMLNAGLTATNHETSQLVIPERAIDRKPRWHMNWPEEPRKPYKPVGQAEKPAGNKSGKPIAGQPTGLRRR